MARQKSKPKTGKKAGLDIYPEPLARPYNKRAGVSPSEDAKPATKTGAKKKEKTSKKAASKTASKTKDDRLKKTVKTGDAENGIKKPVVTTHSKNTDDSDADNHEFEDDYIGKIRRQQKHMPLVDHLDELRSRIIRSLIWIAAFTGIALALYDYVWYFVMAPLDGLVETAKKHNLPVKFITTELSDYFMLKFKLALTTGLLFAVPAIIMEIWKFVLPALDKKKWKWGYLILFFSIVLFWSGIMMARNYLWPLVYDVLIFGMRIPELPIGGGIVPELHLTLNTYLSAFTTFHFAFGLTFQMPIISLLLGMMGLLKSRFFTTQWRIAVVVIAVASAVFTPPDPASMIAMMIPMLGLYGISGLLVLLVERKENSIK